MASSNFPVSDQVRKEVWQGYLDAERLNRYFQWLGDRYRKITQAVKITIAFAAVGGVARIMAFLPEKWYWAADITSVLILILVVCEIVFNFEKKSAVLNRVSEDVQKIHQDWRVLWNQVDRASSSQDDVLGELAKLSTAQRESIALIEQAGLWESRKLNERAMKEADAFLVAQYSVSKS